MLIVEKAVFLASHEIQRPGFYKLFKSLQKRQWKSREVLQDEQDVQLRRMIRFCYDSVPFYRKQFKDLGLTPADIRHKRDLQRLPPLSKREIINNKKTILPVGWRGRYYVRNTGGTTGTPFRYLISHEDRFLAGALLYRGWSAAGYRLGDRMVILGGSSLVQNTLSGLRGKITGIARNTQFRSTFRIDSHTLGEWASLVKSWKPGFIRGYPSSLYEFAKFIQDREISMPQLQGVFTTSENLFPKIREVLQQVFRARVFDGYGASDGGVGAHECECGRMHIDMERSVLEVVDEEHEQISHGRGRVLATSLTNYAMPLLRYDLGDEVVANNEFCQCGRGTPVLKEILGRTVSVLLTPDGSRVHGWFFLYLFWEIGEAVRKYRVVQTSVERISIEVVPGRGFGEHVIEGVRHSVSRSFPYWEVDINVVDSIDDSISGKKHFIMSDLVDT